MASPLLPRLPMEVWDRIIGEFYIEHGPQHYSDDYQSLSSFSVASSCPVILDLCRKRLFARVQIGKPFHAIRLVESFVANEALIPHVKTLGIYPDGPANEEEDYSDDDDDENSSDEEEEEDGLKWEYDENPFENDCVLALLSKLTSVEMLICLAQESKHTHFTECWEDDSVEVWKIFLSLPSIKSMSLIRLAWPVELLGRSPNLEEMILWWIHISRGWSWDEHAAGAFQKLRVLNVRQTDLMGVYLTKLLRVGYIKVTIKSTTFQELELHADGENYDHWAWVDTLSAFTTFGSNSLTTLNFEFPMGFLPHNDFAKHWQKNAKEIGAYVSQLKSLETLRCNFHLCRINVGEDSDIEKHAICACEPYLPPLIDGLVKGKLNRNSTLKRISLVFFDLESFFQYSAGAASVNINRTKMFLRSLAKAPIWPRLDGWIAELSPEEAPRLEVFIQYDPRAPINFNALLEKRLLDQMPNLRKSKAMDLVVKKYRG